MLHTFSPNWYKPQCLFCTTDHIYYASNYLLYQYNLKERKITAQLCLRQLAISLKINFKDIKIHAITGNQPDIKNSQILYVSINQPYIFKLQVNIKEEKSCFTVQSVIKLQAYDQQQKKDKQILPQYIYLVSITHKILIGGSFMTTEGHPQEKYHLFLCQHIINDKLSSEMEDCQPQIKLKQAKIIKITNFQSKRDQIKQILPIQDSFTLVFLLKGIILVLDSCCELIQKNITLNNEIILDADYTFSSKLQKYIISLLTRNSKDSHQFTENVNAFITIFSFEFKEDFLPEQKKKLSEISDSIMKYPISIQYPKKVQAKIKINQQAKKGSKGALSLKLINQNHCIITGKIGEVYDLNLQENYNSMVQFMKDINNKDKNYTLQLRSFSNHQGIKAYSVWTQSNHYKDIYTIKKIALNQNLQYLCMLGTDHTLTVWLNEENKMLEPKYQFAIKFLTTGVSSICYSQADPFTIFLLLRDSIIRSFSPIQTGNHYLNEYWKHSRKNVIVKMACHLSQNGIVGLLTNNNKILIYDLYEDRLIKIVQICTDESNPITSISFQFASIQQPLLGLQKKVQQQSIFSAQNVKIQTVSQRQIDKNVILFCQLKNTNILIQNLHNPYANTKIIQKNKKLERINRSCYWNQHLLLASTNKNGMLVIEGYKKGVGLFQYKQEITYGSARVIFKYSIQNHSLYVILYKGTKLLIQRLQFNQKGGLVKKESTELVTQLTADHIVLDYDTFQAVLYNQRDNYIQSINISKILAGNPSIRLFSYHTKIESLSFFMKQYLVIASKDQAIKVIKIEELQQVEKRKKIRKSQSKNNLQQLQQPSKTMMEFPEFKPILPYNMEVQKQQKYQLQYH